MAKKGLNMGRWKAQKKNVLAHPDLEIVIKLEHLQEFQRQLEAKDREIATLRQMLSGRIDKLAKETGQEISTSVAMQVKNETWSEVWQFWVDMWTGLIHKIDIQVSIVQSIIGRVETYLLFYPNGLPRHKELLKIFLDFATQLGDCLNRIDLMQPKLMALLTEYTMVEPNEVYVDVSPIQELRDKIKAYVNNEDPKGLELYKRINENRPTINQHMQLLTVLKSRDRQRGAHVIELANSYAKHKEDYPQLQWRKWAEMALEDTGYIGTSYAVSPKKVSDYYGIVKKDGDLTPQYYDRNPSSDKLTGDN